MDRIVLDGPDPAEVFTREQLRAALAEVRARSGMSLVEVAARSGELALANRARTLGSARRTLVRLTRTNISGFTTASRDRLQLPGEDAMVTFLLACGIPPSALDAWLAALSRARASRAPADAIGLPRMPEHFVPRPAERRRLLAELRRLAAGGGAIGLASTAALRGTGGFGKTTLALDVCRQPAVRALFPDGVVWLEVGQEPALTVLLADMTARVTGRPPARFGSVSAAAAALAEALEGRRVLLVLDNVWRAGDLEPFLRGGSGCVRLVTCRRADVLPATAAVLPVDRMEPAQAIELLGRDVPGASGAVLYPLYERTHRWPVVLGILNGVLRARSSRLASLPLEQVVEGLARRLDDGGLSGADDLAGAQDRTVREVLAFSLEELAADRSGTALRDRFMSLAAFPPDQIIGFDELAEAWNCDELEARAVCDRLADRSLLSPAELAGVRLHDVIRDHVLYGHHSRIKQWAQRLLETAHGYCANGRWDRIRDERAATLDRLAFWMVFTDHEDELRDLLLDLRFIVRRVVQGGPAGYAADLTACELARGRDPQLSALLRIVELEGHLALRATDAAGMAATLWARLLGDPVVSGLISHREEALADSPVAIHPMPDQPDRRLVWVSSGYADHIRALCWQPDGAKLAAGSADGMVRIFNRAGGVLRAVDLEAEIKALAWSPDRIHLAALVGESELCLLEPILGEVTQRRVAGEELTCLAWTPSGLAAGCRDGGVLVWESASDQVTRRDTTSITAVQAMQWGGQELGLVLAHSDGTVAGYGGGKPASAETGLNVPRALAVRPGGAEVAVGAASSTLVLVDMNETPPEIVATSAPTPGWITSVGWSSDGTWLAAGLQDGAVALWSSAPDGVHDLAQDLDARRAAWEERLGAQPLLDYHGQRVAALAWHPAESVVAVATHTDTRLFDLGRDPGSVSRSGVNCLRRHPYRGLFAAGGMDGELIFLSAVNPEVRHTFHGHSGGVRTLAFDPAGERLLTAAEQGPMLMWDLRGIDGGEAGATPLRCPVALAGAVAWSPDGERVAVGGDKQIVVLDAGTLRELSRFDVADLVNGLDFDPSGKWLAVATVGRDVGVCQMSGEPARWLSSHVSTVSAVRWIDERRLASAGYDGRLIVWSPWEGPCGTVLETIDPGGGAAWDVTATRTAIMTVTYAGLLSLHPLDGGRRACTIALDTALSSCDVSADATILAVAGSAGTALFKLPEWAAGA